MRNLFAGGLILMASIAVAAVDSRPPILNASLPQAPGRISDDQDPAISCLVNSLQAELSHGQEIFWFSGPSLKKESGISIAQYTAQTQFPSAAVYLEFKAGTPGSWTQYIYGNTSKIGVQAASAERFIKVRTIGTSDRTIDLTACERVLTTAHN